MNMLAYYPAWVEERRAKREAQAEATRYRKALEQIVSYFDDTHDPGSPCEYCGMVYNPAEHRVTTHWADCPFRRARAALESST